MTAAVASRVVAEIYRGVDFPSDWADRDGLLNIGMARDLVISVAAMFDIACRPVALCWQIVGRDERFVRTRSRDGDDASLLDELDNDLAQQSLQFGAADLLATMLWAPDKLRSDQGQSVRRIVFARGRYSASMTGWNVPPRTLVAQASNLLIMTRRVDAGLALPVPTSAEDMHHHMGTSDPSTLIVLPVKSVKDVPKENVGRKMALLFGGLLATGIVICAYLLNSG